MQVIRQILSNRVFIVLALIAAAFVLLFDKLVYAMLMYAASTTLIAAIGCLVWSVVQEYRTTGTVGILDFLSHVDLVKPEEVQEEGHEQGQ